MNKLSDLPTEYQILTRIETEQFFVRLARIQNNRYIRYLNNFGFQLNNTRPERPFTNEEIRSIHFTYPVMKILERAEVDLDSESWIVQALKNDFPISSVNYVPIDLFKLFLENMGNNVIMWMIFEFPPKYLVVIYGTDYMDHINTNIHGMKDRCLEWINENRGDRVKYEDLLFERPNYRNVSELTQELIGDRGISNQIVARRIFNRVTHQVLSRGTRDYSHIPLQQTMGRVDRSGRTPNVTVIPPTPREQEIIDRMNHRNSELDRLMVNYFNAPTAEEEAIMNRIRLIRPTLGFGADHRFSTSVYPRRATIEYPLQVKEETAILRPLPIELDDDPITFEPIGQYYRKCMNNHPHYFDAINYADYCRQSENCFRCPVDKTYMIDEQLYKQS